MRVYRDLLGNLTMAAFLFVFCPLAVASAQTSPQYQTEEFKDPNSRIPSVFLCMFVGDWTGIAPDASELAIQVLLDMDGVAPEPLSCALR